MNEFSNSLWLLFIDYKPAYDTVSRKELGQATGKMGLPTKLIRLTMCTMKNTLPELKLCRVNAIIKRVGMMQHGTIFNILTQVMAFTDTID